MRSKVFIPQLIPEVALDRLKRVAEVEFFPIRDRVITPGELLKAVKGKNYLYALAEIPFTAEVIDAALPDLKGIAAMYIFPKFVDIKTATKRGIPVTGIPNMLVETTAEFTFALLIGTAWRLPEGDRLLREKGWKQYQSMTFSRQGSMIKLWELWGWERSANPSLKGLKVVECGSSTRSGPGYRPRRKIISMSNGANWRISFRKLIS